MRALSLCLALSFSLAGPGGAELFRYLAMGDSITAGFNDDLSGSCQMLEPGGGYPGRGDIARISRLPELLGCDGVTTCEVVNEGLGAEKTSDAITRLNGILAADAEFDVMILMEGSNDLFQKFNPLPEEAIRDNLDTMAVMAAALGIDTVHASIVWFHPQGDRGTTRDAEIESLRDLVASLAAAENRYFADQWSVLCPPGNDRHGHPHSTGSQGCFTRHYCEDSPGNPTDPWIIGHPNPSGFDMMSAEFFDVITAVDVPERPAPLSPAGDIGGATPTFSWTRESPQHANWYHLQIDGGSTMDAWFAGIDVCSGTSCSVSLTTPLAAGDHTWRLRGRNPKGRSPFTSDRAFRVFTHPPSAVSTLSAPIGDRCVTGPLNPTYSWLESTDATEYRLEVSGSGGSVTDEVFDTQTSCAAGSCSATPGLGLSGGVYTWRVQARNPAGAAPFSPTSSFGVFDTVPARSTGVYPGGDVLVDTPTYQWAQVPGASDYGLAVSGGASIPPPSTAGFSCDGITCSVSPTTPSLAPGSYAWSVTPRNCHGSGATSAPVPFSILACSHQDLSLDNDTVTDLRTETACNRIEAGNLTRTPGRDYRIEAGGNLTLHAGHVIELHDGFEVRAGGVLTLIVDR